MREEKRDLRNFKKGDESFFSLPEAIRRYLYPNNDRPKRPKA